jgi:hypothetical protein
MTMSRASTPSSTQQTGGHTPAGHQSPIPHDKIAMRAYEKWCRRGRPHGTDKQDWMEAEQELRTEMTHGTTSPMGQHRR